MSERKEGESERAFAEFAEGSGSVKPQEFGGRLRRTPAHRGIEACEAGEGFWEFLLISLKQSVPCVVALTGRSVRPAGRVPPQH